MAIPVTAVNWNNVPEIDREVWDRVTKNFWLDTKVPLSNDLKSWRTLTDAEKLATMRVFANLATLDTLQGEVGAPRMAEWSKSHFEAAIYANFAFMEHVHAKSYSSIFTTLSNTPAINDAFRWAEEDECVQRKAKVIQGHYRTPVTFFVDDSNPHKKSAEMGQLIGMASSVLLESFLFFSGFYLPFKFSANAKLTNTADIIRLILRDEAIHGYYIGQKFQERFSQLGYYEQEAVQTWIMEIAENLYQNEMRFTEDIYDEIGWTEGAKKYVRYNANKAMQNLGFPDMFTPEEARVEASILSQLSSDANETHDFFSGSGSSYVIGNAEETTDDDWA